jgi:hypothetical protein
MAGDAQGGVMTDKEFHKLCKETQKGTTLSFNTGEQHVYGKFVGCSDGSVIIEAHGRDFIWPRDMIDYREADYPFPTYS